MTNILRILMCCISLSVWACFAQAESDFVYKKVTSQDEIVDGGVYVLVRIHNQFPGYAKAEGFTSNAFSVENDDRVFNNQDEFYASNACELTLSKKDNGYNVKTYGGYIYVYNNKLSMKAAGDQEKNSVWKFSIDESNNNYLTMQLIGGQSYRIAYYQSAFRFVDTSSNNSTSPINLYRKCQKINIASETGYTTLCSNHALDFTDTGVKAYTAEVADNKVLLKQVTRISAQRPVILHGTKGTFTVNVTNAAPSQEDQSAIGSNALRGVTEESGLTVNGDKEYYALTEKEGKAVFAPVKQGVTIPKGKAYFALPKTSEAKSLSIVIEDDMTTSIPQPHISSTPTQAYTLMGTRASDSYRGIVIINGKKHLVK